MLTKVAFFFLYSEYSKNSNTVKLQFRFFEYEV